MTFLMKSIYLLAFTAWVSSSYSREPVSKPAAEVIVVRPLPLPDSHTLRMPRPILLGAKYKNIEFKGLIRDTSITVLDFLTIPLASSVNFKALGPAIQVQFENLKVEIIKNKEQFNTKLLIDLLVSIANTNVVTDIDTLLQFILKEVAKAASIDLKEMLDEMQNALKTKEALREQLNNSQKVLVRCRQTPCDFSLNELEAKVAKLKEQLDSLSEMNEMDALRLQQYMDRRSKMLETLSNLLKKISDTASSVIQNMK